MKTLPKALACELCGQFALGKRCNSCWAIRPLTYDSYELPEVTRTRAEVNAAIRHSSRQGRGMYDVPLPPPADRKRIREQAGVTQGELGATINVTRDTIGRFEKPAGYRNGRRLPGREPSGETRRLYAAALRDLETQPPQ